MAVSKDSQIPKKGMNRDTSPFELQKDEYCFALNANIHDEHGSGRVVLQNEPSNIKCSGFKDGYKVIGHKYDINRDRTFFFLTNPTLNISEIGVISSFFDNQGLTPNEQVVNGSITVVLETPLELQTQEANCIYTTIISDYCELTETATGCLNFSLDFPIKESNIQIKDEKTGVNIYFTDDFNPQRYIKLDYLSEYNQTKDDCTGEITETCLQCDKMRVFPLHNKPCIRPRIIQNGGNLKAGLYEFLIAASDSEGNELTDYYGITNPVPIHDKNNRVLDQTLLDYETNQAIGLDIFDFDQTFEYYKITTIYRSGLDAAVSVFENGVYSSDQTQVTIYTLKDKTQLELADVISRRVFYTKARGLSTSNGYLFHYGLTQHRTINLQPVINLMGSLGRWMTVQATEKLHEDGVFISNFEGYMRDEVYPFGVKFFKDGGYELPLGVFIPRPPTASEIEVLNGPGSTFVSNTNTDSVLENNPECTEDLRNKRWQFENTATIDEDICLSPTPVYDEFTEQREEQDTCYVSLDNGSLAVVATIEDSSFEYESNVDIVTYINTNSEAIISSMGTNGEDIRNILSNPDAFVETCDPNFGSNCDEDYALLSEEIFAISVDTQIVSSANKEFTDYDRIAPPPSCNIYQIDEDGSTITEDTDFMTDFMEVGEVVYKRLGSPANQVCSAANLLMNPQPSLPNYLINKGEITTYTTLQTSLNASLTRVDHYLTLTGTSGTANIVVGGTPYLATFNTNLTTTAIDFVNAHSTSILTTFGIIVSSSAGVLQFTGLFAGFPTIVVTNLTGDLDATYERIMFTDKIHSNGLWFTADFLGREYVTVEMSPTLCSNGDDNSSNQVRISVFDSCSSASDIPIYSRIVYDVTSANDINKFLELNSADFGGSSGSAYIVIDSPIRAREISATVVNTLTPSCGCFYIFQRDVLSSRLVNYTNLTFGKKQTYQTTCSFQVPIPNDCDPAPYQKGKFAYWESVETYPCNEELFDSSNLTIPADSLPEEYREEFESYYVDSIVNGTYVLNSQTNFMNRPIRHYKFPSSNLVPFMSSTSPGDFTQSMIYPIGFFIPNSVINAFLDIAVLNGILSEEERSQINKYEIFRGDRRVDKSIIAKGLLYDMYQYQEENGDVVHYPNYPLNSLGIDNFNIVNHPHNSESNRLFSFHSPETSFYKPTLPRELMVEGYQFGKSANYFDEVEGHPTYVLLGDDAYLTATILGIAESGLELLLQVSEYILQGITAGTVGGTVLGAAAAIALGASVAAASAFKAGEYRLKWIETFYNLGRPTNFAYYQAALGYYNYLEPNQVANSNLRGITVASYLPAGRFNVVDETSTNNEDYNINKIDREDSVFISLGKVDYNIQYPINYRNYDNRDTNPDNSSRVNYEGVGRSGRIVKNVASPYASLKQYLPAQYGGVYSIEWVNTGHCGNLESQLDCDPIFGGDIFISRFSLKRKLPFFTTDSFDQAPLTPFKYSDYFNINPPDVNATSENINPRFYIDYQINDDADNYVALVVFPSNRSRFNLDFLTNEDGFYVKPPSKFYLYSYGIPYFLVESEINCNFRYAKREPQENFYPNMGDIIEWTQEGNVSIKEPNTYFYNRVYSQGHSFYPWRMLPSNYSKEVYDKLSNLTNSVIYSRQDVTQNSLTDPWLLYKALDFYEFEKSFGTLVDMDGIESEQILARFINGFSIFGAFDQLRDRLNSETGTLGSGGIFAGRTVTFNKTDLGYGGTQHSAKVSCEFGHFWVDAKRGKVFQLSPNGKGLEEISAGSETINSGLEKWFKENLPFKILGFVDDLTDMNLDNNYKGIGIVMGWDDRLKRVFITKKDYIPLENTCYSNGSFYNTDVNEYSQTIAQYESAGYTFTGFDRCRLRFEIIDDNDELYEVFIAADEVRLGDSNYFEDCSFTIAYNPLLKAWISYYSFKPDYYISYNTHFQTGLNFSAHSEEIGLWSHLSFLSSYQVFYGRRYPFIIEYALPTKLSDSVLHCIEYYLDVRKYYDKYNSANVYGIGFNKAFIYNSFQNSGQLNLVFQNDDDIRQNLIYPQHNPNSIDILQSGINQKFTFNYFYNLIRNERSGLPIWIQDANQIDKTLNDQLLDYSYNLKDRLRGDYFLVRLINDEETRYKFAFRVGIAEQNYYGTT